MSIKKIVPVASTLSVCLLMLFVYPSSDKSMNAGQSKLTRDIPALTNVHQVSVSSDAVIAHYFGKDVVEKIMKQPGCVSVRAYYGKHSNGRSGFIFVGVDKYGKDIAPVVIAAPMPICPPYCGL